MSRTLVGNRIFVASPGDVASERAIVRTIVDEFNSTVGYEQGAAFFVRGWEQLSGTVGRPQEVINQSILRDCDYLIMILGARWGTPPQLGDGYDSGTEEEFFEALTLLADAEAPMRDVLIMFKDAGRSALEGVDRQMEKVLSFRDRLERGRQMLFNVFDTDIALAGFVRGALTQWSRDKGDKVPKVVSLPSPLPTENAVPGTPLASLLALATAKASDGLAVQAERWFEAAIADGDPEALIQFAKFMRRTGRYGRAIELNERILTNPITAQSSAPQDKVRRARALAGIGIVRRLIGELAGSRDALEEALSELGGLDASEDLAYVNDNLAHTLSQMGLANLADKALERASEARAQADPKLWPSSLVNEAQAALRRGERGRAIELVEAALSGPDPLDAPLRARALAISARANFEMKNYPVAVELAQQCLEINVSAKNTDGTSIAESLLARATMELGDLQAARTYARSSLERNLASGNATGLASSYWTLAQIASREGDAPEVAEFIEHAVSVARDSGNAPISEAIERWILSYSSSQGEAA